MEVRISWLIVARNALLASLALSAPAQAAPPVAKILTWARPQDVSVEGAEKIDLAVNLKTAELLGLSPRKILFRASARWRRAHPWARDRASCAALRRALCRSSARCPGR